MKISVLLLCLCWAAVLKAQQPVLEIDGTKPRKPISASQYGIFFEEISNGGEGGLYGEMIQNRSFEDHVIPGGTTLKDGVVYAAAKPNYFSGKLTTFRKRWNVDPLANWALTTAGSAKATVKVIDSLPLNASTPHAAMLSIASADKSNVASFANKGFWGISVKAGEKYNLRIFIRQSANYTGNVLASFVSSKGSTVGSVPLTLKKAGVWNEYRAQLTASATDDKAVFSLGFNSSGQVLVDFISLFPEKTFKNRPNGLRADVAQTVADLKPSFIRWPGGCIVEGLTIENRVKWKETIGDPVMRPGQYNLWGYRNTYGWGYHEYLQFCEDIHADALYVTSVGLACEFRNGDFCSEDSVKYFIQDALDAIEYAIGDVKTPWGAKRAAAGHPAPFPLKYVEIGNENRGSMYYQRHNQFYSALKAKYPQLNYILNTNFGDAQKIINEAKKEVPKADVADMHWYVAPEWFFEHTTMFDSVTTRNDFKIYVGEYASNKEVGTGNFYAALSEAAFIAGMERNSDIVTMTSYAPLFENSNRRSWPVNLIWMDNDQVFGRSSYYVQKLYAENRPSENLAARITVAGQPVKNGKGNLKQYAIAGYDKSTKEIVIKVINAEATAFKPQISLKGLGKIAATGSVVTLSSGSEKDENTFEQPQKIVPVKESFSQFAPGFAYTFKPYSFTILRVKAE